MNKYYLNRNRQFGSGNNHEIHKEGCFWMPSNPIDLGYHFTDQSALAKARSLGYHDADGCIHCCPSIHKE